MKHVDRSMIFLKFQFGISSMKIPFGIDSAGRTDEKKSKERREMIEFCTERKQKYS